MSAAPHIALALALALPSAAAAEGARIVFDCKGADGAAVAFTIMPLHTDPTGKGPIEVGYAGASYDGVAASDRGPFQFGTETDHFALLIEGQTDDGRLQVRLHHATASSSTLTPYTCETDF